jgi:hypothetical protein
MRTRSIGHVKHQIATQLKRRRFPTAAAAATLAARGRAPTDVAHAGRVARRIAGTSDGRIGAADRSRRSPHRRPFAGRLSDA